MRNVHVVGHHRAASLTALACVVGSCVVAASSALAAPGAPYRYVEIPMLPGAVSATAMSINDAGDVVGLCRFPGVQGRGYIYNHAAGTLIDMGAMGSLSAAGEEVAPFSINIHGEVVGTFSVNSLPRAFYWNGAGYINICVPPPGATNTLSGQTAGSIGSNGMIIGNHSFLCTPTFAVPGAARWPDQTTAPASIISTPFPCTVGGRGFGGNNVGDACGDFVSQVNGFTWNRPFAIIGGVRFDLPTAAGPSEHGAALDINDGGHSCGFAEGRPAGGPVTSMASLWSPAGVRTNLDLPAGAGPFSSALALNEDLDVVGWAGASPRATVWRAGGPAGTLRSTVLVNALPGGTTLSRCEDINNHGMIVGRTNEQSSTGRGFLLIPCPRAACAGDANGDLVVDFADLNLVLGNFGVASDFGDADCSGVVNFTDLNLVLGNFGNVCP